MCAEKLSHHSLPNYKLYDIPFFSLHDYTNWKYHLSKTKTRYKITAFSNLTCIYRLQFPVIRTTSSQSLKIRIDNEEQ